MAKVGARGLAVFYCLGAGVCPSVLVGRVEFGSPGAISATSFFLNCLIASILSKRQRFRQLSSMHL